MRSHRNLTFRTPTPELRAAPRYARLWQSRPQMRTAHRDIQAPIVGVFGGILGRNPAAAGQRNSIQLAKSECRRVPGQIRVPEGPRPALSAEKSLAASHRQRGESQKE